MEEDESLVSDVNSHMVSLKECPAISNLKFEKECRRRSLDFEEDENPWFTVNNTKFDGLTDVTKKNDYDLQKPFVFLYNIYKIERIKVNIT